MRTIYKYPVDMAAPRFPVEMPGTIKVVHVQMQGDQPMMWVEVDPEMPEAEHDFAVVGTGHPVPFDGTVGSDTTTCGEHVGSWQDGIFMWHLYRVFPL